MNSIPVLSTNPRSGTHYLKTLIAHAADLSPVERDNQDAEVLLTAIESRESQQLIYGHFRHSIHSSVLDASRFPTLRMVVLTRHPFDRLISQINFARATGAELPTSSAPPDQIVRDLLLGRYDGGTWLSNNSIEKFADWHNFLQRDLVSDWLGRPGTMCVKFEDLIQDPARELQRCLNHYEIEIWPERIVDAVQAVDFRRLSGGRSPGEVDEASHYRRGIVGEWRDLFGHDDVELLRREFGPVLECLGYNI